VTNQAPRNPSTNPINGLEMANQSGSISLRGSASRVRLRKRVTLTAKGIGLSATKGFEVPATSKEWIVFMIRNVRDDQIGTTARVWDFPVPRPSQSTFPLWDENRREPCQIFLNEGDRLQSLFRDRRKYTARTLAELSLAAVALRHENKNNF